MTHDQAVQLILAAVGAVFTLAVTVLGALIVSKLNLIHTTVNSNLAAQVQATQTARDENISLGAHIVELNQTITELIAASASGGKH